MNSGLSQDYFMNNELAHDCHEQWTYTGLFHEQWTYT